MDCVGHSLGGALASIAAVSVKSNIPPAAVRLFTYGVLSSWAHRKVARILYNTGQASHVLGTPRMQIS